ncbi:hypothetical protein KDA_73570 [Dictyobacter alpinus]|uniref:DUF1579 domain-containing protein n=1 Tax=Dictyobacter alpinus TaxID=2014873 RepID=A0A402BKI4_9CHLR|nr:hypothetical protein [Dictyobacter alpinus]GCE31873.1 hypothetical protein KDA_73570 [Dictyobacter alpinus]
MTEKTNPQVADLPVLPDADLKSLEKLIGTWTLSGDTTGQVSYEWMEGGFFLLQHVDFEHNGHVIKGLEVIGHLKPFGEESGKDIMSRFYSSTGDTLDYVYELKDNILIIWGGQKGSPAYYQGTFNADGTICAGGWVFPGGGGYSSTMTRVVN